jgi:hypothetical protein
VENWIASRSLSSGAHSRDPLARNDVQEVIGILELAVCPRFLAIWPNMADPGPNLRRFRRDHALLLRYPTAQLELPKP